MPYRRIISFIRDPLSFGIVMYFLVLSSSFAIYNYAIAPPEDTIILDKMLFQEVMDIANPDLDEDKWSWRSLPDDWKQSSHDSRNGIYRAILPLNIPPNRLWAIYLPSVNMNAAVYLNGNLLGHGGQFDKPMARNLNRPLNYSIPNGLLRSGDNLIEVRLRAGLAEEGLIDRIYLGPEELIQDAYKLRYFMRITLVLGITASMLLLSVLLGGLWLYRRQDTVYGWVAFMSIMWTVHNLNLLVVNVPFSTKTWNWLVHSTLGWFVIAMIFASHRIINIAPKGLEKLILWGGIGLTILLAILLHTTPYYPVIKHIWNSLFTLLGVYPLVRVYLAYRRENNSELPFIVMAGLIVISFGGHDWQMEVGLWERTGGYIIQYSSPVLLFVFVIILISRFITSLNEQEKLNLELEQRVALKHQELQDNYNKLSRLEREKVLVEERERIMMDMHDGVGGHLVSTLALLEGDELDTEKIKKSLNDGLMDLRFMIDSLDPVEDDLTTVLGMWRNRMQPVLDVNNTRFDWQVTNLPEIENFGPKKILHILRILQETTTNILKHANASLIVVRTGHLVEEESEIIFVEIRDNGTEFKENKPQGHGLTNMKNRAKQIGGEIDLTSNDSGTTMRLILSLKNAS